jgi:hypothetical protein
MHLVRLPLGKESENGDSNEDQHAKEGVLADTQRLSSALTTRLVAR